MSKRNAWTDNSCSLYFFCGCYSVENSIDNSYPRDWTTNDIYGKFLHNFEKIPNKRVSGLTEDENDELAPLIFWVLIGHFRSNPENLKTEGLFRITSSGSQMRIIEAHIRAGNFAYLKTLGNTDKANHLITNLIKRVLRNMKQPLIPYKYYDLFMQLDKFPEERKLA